MSDDTPTRYTLACDFDGVLHSYTSGWAGATVIPDPPIGAVEGKAPQGEPPDSA